MTRPLPNLENPLNAEFWAGTVAGELRVQECLACGYRRWPPSKRCPDCLHPEFRVVHLAPEGTVWSFATYERSFHPAFAEEIPYVVGLIELESEVMMVGNIVGEAAPYVGAPVRAVFEQVTPEVTLVQWHITG